MKITEMNWSQLDVVLAHDKRAVIPLGRTGQRDRINAGQDGPGEIVRTQPG